ncbi:MAG: AAC(3) family N-acetyltransferase [Kiritimatiellae bacterium]|nr:AAC(3) family N-acetyltransferase [Kiritimatiellia bacterium]
MKNTDINRLAKLFRVQHARRIATDIWERTRWMDTPALRRGVEIAAQHLRDAGINDVNIEQLPADGKTSAAGWIMPMAWDIKEAKLETAKSGKKIVFADYALNPQNIATYSPPTPGGKWVDGNVVSSSNPLKLKSCLKGKFLLLEGKLSRFDLVEFAARKGALAVITITDHQSNKAARWLNAAVPFDAKRQCVPCFSLTPADGRKLSHMLKSDPQIRLRARVKAKRYAGTLPMLTGTVGSGSPEIYVAGHIDEIGALDNASGCGVAIEALRVLQKIYGSKGFTKQKRCIRFFFSSEVRGQQGFLNCTDSSSNFVTGINLDMVGEKTGRKNPQMIFRTGFRHIPHFAAHVLREAVETANREVGKIGAGEGKNFVSDGAFGAAGRTGHVSLEQETGWTYHSSADTPALLCNHTLKWTGVATTAFLYKISRMDNQEVLRLAKKIRTKASGKMRNRDKDAVKAGKWALTELRTLRKMIYVPPVCHKSSPAECYRAGISKTTGCWPEIKQKDRLNAEIQTLKDELRPNTVAHNRITRTRESGKADNLVPLSLFKGFLSFEDRIGDKAVKKLKRRTGQIPGWGTASWVWMLPTFFNGKRTLTEILTELDTIGVEIDPTAAVNLTRYLTDIGRVRLQPILNGKAIHKAIKTAGVRKGSILMTHTSLSRFGYIQGGAKTVITALLDVLGPQGTLIMPTHSNNLLGGHPYIKEDSRSNSGAITEYFRNMPGVLRSAHPTHSVTAYGPAAAELVNAHHVDQAPLARAGFWGKLYDMNGNVLLMCPIKSATIFHTGETWTDLPQLSVTAHAIDGNGRRKVYVLPSAPQHVEHFEQTMAKPLIRRKIMKEVRLGEEIIRFAAARAMADISVRVNRRNPLVSIGGNGTCDCFYCNCLKKGINYSSF